MQAQAICVMIKVQDKGDIMSNRDIALYVVRKMSDEQINAFLSLFADKNLLARIEAENIAIDIESPPFDNVDDLVDELLSD